MFSRVCREYCFPVFSIFASGGGVCIGEQKGSALMLSDPSDFHLVGRQRVLVLFVTSDNGPVGFSNAHILLFSLYSRDTTC